MDDLKIKLLALDPKQKFLLTAGGGILVMLLYLILPQVSVNFFFVSGSINGAQCFTGESALLLITSLAMVILPILSAYLTYAKKSVNPLLAYILTGLYLLFGLILGSGATPAAGWWITLVISIAWCVVSGILKDTEAYM